MALRRNPRQGADLKIAGVQDEERYLREAPPATVESTWIGEHEPGVKRRAADLAARRVAKRNPARSAAGTLCGLTPGVVSCGK